MMVEPDDIWPLGGWLLCWHQMEHMGNFLTLGMLVLIGLTFAGAIISQGLFLTVSSVDYRLT